MYKDYILGTTIQLGGFEIDGHSIKVNHEMPLFFRRKCNMDSYRDALYLFVMIERGASKCVLATVLHRSA